MQFAHQDLAGVSGLHFYKLMGSGKGMGFNPLPDWSVYSLLQVWDCDEDATAFFEHSDLIKQYQSRSSEVWTLFMRNIKSDGLWSKQNPFSASSQLDHQNPLIAVITRATIKSSKLAHFWSYVPTSQKPIADLDGLIYTKGIGEAPIVQMATFSLWENAEALKAFAYRTPEHQKAIQKTRTLNWYKEELFARFQPYKSLGSWEDLDFIKYFGAQAIPSGIDF